MLGLASMAAVGRGTRVAAAANPTIVARVVAAKARALQSGCTSGLWGDANGDGAVNIVDAQQMARFAVGLSVASVAAIQAYGDVTGDLAVNIVDAQQVARYAVGLSAAARVNTPAPANPVVASILISPINPTIQVNQTVQLSATPYDANGVSLASCVTPAFSSSNTAIATVTPTGTVQGIQAGTTQIFASGGPVNTSVDVTVQGGSTGGSGPLRVSTVNPRYFVDGAGTPVYLVGSHTWADFQDVGPGDPPPVFDYAAFLDFLVAHGHNFTKLWSFENERWSQDLPGDNFWATPVPFLRTGPGLALDGKPKFDLTQFNPVFFDRLRQRIIAAGQRGIYVSVMFFEGESLEPDAGKPGQNPWPGHPFHRANNINGIDGDPDNDNAGLETHRLQVPAVTARQEAYVRHLIDAVNDLDNVLWEISLEDRAGAEAWQNHMIQVVRQYEATKPKQHPIGMSALSPGGQNSDLFASSADWISPNGSVDLTPVATGSKVILQDTDHLCGTCTDRSWPWRNFTRGVNSVFMDPYDGALPYNKDRNTLGDPVWEATRANMRFALSYARRLSLLAMQPHGELATSGYCLANPAASNGAYLVFVPAGKRVRVDLVASRQVFMVEWFLPDLGRRMAGPDVAGGDVRTFTPPSSGDAVIYLRARAPM